MKNGQLLLLLLSEYLLFSAQMKKRPVWKEKEKINIVKLHNFIQLKKENLKRICY